MVPSSHSAVNLSAFTTPFPKPGVLPDITFGVGNAAYNLAQGGVEALLPPLVQALSAAGGLSGLNLTNLINQLPKNLLSQILDALPIKLTPLLNAALGPLLTGALVPLLSALGIMDAQGNVTLSGLLDVLGISLDNILDLSGLDIPGVNIVTAGPVFTLLKIAGLDLGWTPGTANAIANAINNTDYLDVGAMGLINEVLDRASNLGGLGPLISALQVVINTVGDAIGLDKLDLIDVRVPLSVGFGLGAFSMGQAYSKVLADLANQPGGANHSGPVLGSLTVLPMILLNNLGRANGGLLARFYPIGDLLGINLITPDVAAAHSGGIPLLNTGLSIGGASLLPIKVDATLEYQPFSDLAAWPNPFSLANNLVAGTLPTYLLRGISTATLTNQLTSQLGDLTGGLLSGNPLAVNIYLTIPTNTLPLMEPMYLTGDVLNMVSFGTLGSPIYKLANALAPAMTSLVNLGYTDVVRNADGTYSRTLDDAATPTPFFSFPNVNWQKVPADIMNSLVAGFKKEFFSANPTAAPDNAVEALIKLLTGGKLGSFNPLGGLAGTVQNLLNGVLGTLGGLTQGATVNSLAAKEGVVSPTAATDIPSTTPKLAPLSASLTGLTGTSKKDGKQATDQTAGEKGKTAEDTTGTTPAAEDPKTDPKAEPKVEDTKTDPKTDPKSDTKTDTEQSGGKHAAEEGTPSTPDSGKKPKHAADDADGTSTAGKDKKADKPAKTDKVTKDTKAGKDKSEKVAKDSPKTKKQKKEGAAKSTAATGGGSAAHAG
ncbi:ATPase AAA [Mycolicibacterium phocaicum]|nr:ATPase AAA [Mycolicibacterium phocaicum]